MTTPELKKAIKNIIIAQNGKLYNFNIITIQKAFGVSGTAIQNAINYFQYSPTQAKFREKYNFH